MRHLTTFIYIFPYVNVNDLIKTTWLYRPDLKRKKPRDPLSAKEVSFWNFFFPWFCKQKAEQQELAQHQ